MYTSRCRMCELCSLLCTCTAANMRSKTSSFAGRCPACRAAQRFRNSPRVYLLSRLLMCNSGAQCIPCTCGC